MNNQKGVTLIEVLASIVLLTIVTLLTFNLLISGQNEHTKQVSANTELQDVSYAMKLLTKDIRKATKAEIITESPNVEFKILDYNGIPIASYWYERDTAQLNRNGYVIANAIVQFDYSLDSSSIFVELKNSSQKTYSTKLYFREGE